MESGLRRQPQGDEEMVRIEGIEGTMPSHGPTYFVADGHGPKADVWYMGCDREMAIAEYRRAGGRDEREIAQATRDADEMSRRRR